MENNNWQDIVGNVGSNQYSTRIEALESKNFHTEQIKKTVDDTLRSLHQSKSFVIFGEPQSGKTEMMIALNARLLDEGHKIIVNLLTDSVDLLDQSLRRFRESGLSPSPKQFNELPQTPSDLSGQRWVVFCKKNARDLEKLNEYLRRESGFIVIDDEADYASPNSKVNSEEHDKTTINRLITNLIRTDGTYIGVTATPARLNLNNTFNNDSEKWVDFRPHPLYVGQDFFFPQDEKCSYELHTFKADEGDERAEIERAVLHFLCGVAAQHSADNCENFTMLIHTSGKKDEHAEDMEIIRSVLSKLSNANGKSFERIRKKLWAIAVQYSDRSDEIGKFVLRNIQRNTLVEINSKNPTPGKVAQISNPTSLFSFGVGGNIISRGVTFNNLLSMYFTRSVKGKFSQDTYIQRARMFGSRELYKKYFQLWIPEELMGNWSKCFTFHKLAIEALRSEVGAPVWLADHKTTPTSSASIDRSSVDFESGEMSFVKFRYSKDTLESLFERGTLSDEEMLLKLRKHFNEKEFPDYVYSYLKQELSPTFPSISFHKPSGFGTKQSHYSQEEIFNIRRKKGIFATNEYIRSEFPEARHHIKVFYNNDGMARIFYKINGKLIKFIQNRK